MMRRQALAGMAAVIAMTAALMAAPVQATGGADVKAGVDAWAQGDYRKAVEQWRGPAIAGDADAQFNLAQAYKLGRGVPVDPALAESWFRKAALQGHLQAEDNYGLALFQSGRKAEALPWLEKSVARGEPRTQLVLGTMLFNADGMPRDWPRAYALMTRASAAGLQSASQTLAQMDQYITPADRERGTRLAQQYAAQASALPPAPSPRPGSVRDAAPTAVARGTDRVPADRRPVEPRPTPTPPAPAKVAAAPKPKQTPPAPTGRWRVQLGAFSTQANAQTQWSRLHARLAGAQPTYARAGKVVRLQAGPYASRADATRACSSAKTSCVVVAP